MTIAPGVELPDAPLAEICRRYKVKELMLFGSAARGEMRPDSDVDLLVEFLPESGIDLLDHIAAENELTELLGRKVDLVSKRGLRERLRKIILAEARPLYAPQPNVQTSTRGSIIESRGTRNDDCHWHHPA